MGKRFLRSMRGGEVITHNCRAPLTELIRTKCPDNGLGAKFKYLVRQLLLPAQRALLARLCVFLHKLSKNPSKTRMDCHSLATCFVFLINPETNFAAKQPKPAEKKQSADATLLATIRAEVEQTKFRIAVIETLIS